MTLAIEDGPKTETIPFVKAPLSSAKVAMGLRIAALRQSKGMTQQDIAAHFAVSIAAVSMWEKGKTEPGIEKIIKLADILHSTPEFIAFGIAFKGGKRLEH